MTMTDTQALPTRNLFLLLDQDPQSLWNRGTLESALARYEASIELVGPCTGSIAPSEEDPQFLDELWAATLDPELRQQHASVARVHWTAWHERIGELNAVLADLTAKGYVSESERAVLHSRFSDLPGCVEVDRRLLEHLAQAPPPVLSPRHLRPRPEQQTGKQPRRAGILPWSVGSRQGEATRSGQEEKPAQRAQEGSRSRTAYLASLGAALVAGVAVGLVLSRLNPLERSPGPTATPPAATVPVTTAPIITPPAFPPPPVTTGPRRTSFDPRVTQAIHRSTRAWEMAMQCACSGPLTGSEAGSALAGDRRTVATLKGRGEQLVVAPADPQVTLVTGAPPTRVVALARGGTTDDLYTGNQFQAHCGAISTMQFTLQPASSGWIITAVQPQRLCSAP